MSDRREALKIIGAIGATCAYPFSADELYGQHAHPAPGPEAPLPQAPQAFDAREFTALTRLADLIIPETETPGAVAAGVPAYIDDVAGRNVEVRKILRDGLRWLDRKSRRRWRRRFAELDEAEQVTLLEPLCAAADEMPPPQPQPRGAVRRRGKSDVPPEVQFFRVVKNLTADGYYTSRAGLLEELGYAGNQALGEFPVCS
jgi:gluconate 2-dehydrogenase gamma chain